MNYSANYTRLGGTFFTDPDAADSKKIADIRPFLSTAAVQHIDIVTGTHYEKHF